MFPYIDLLCCSLKSEIIGIILSFFVFLWVSWVFSKALGLNYLKLVSLLYLFLIFPYLLGRWMDMALTYKIIIPTSIKQLLGLFFSADLWFNLVGVVIGFLVALVIFLRFSTSKGEMKKWIDAIVYSFFIAAFVMGIFLTLGDNFYGRVTDSFWGISSFEPSSNIYGMKVYPVWLFISLLSLIVFIIGISILHFKKRAWWGWFMFLIWLIGINVVYVYVFYSRQWILIIGEWMTTAFLWLVWLLIGLIGFALVSKKLQWVRLGLVVLLLVAYLYFWYSFVKLLNQQFVNQAIGFGWYSFDLVNYVTIIIALWMILFYLRHLKWN